MGRLLLPFFCFLALTINGVARGATSNVELSTAGTPPGFGELTSARVTMVDVYFGGRKIVETLVTTKPGSLQFRSPQDVLGAMPQLIASPDVTSALALELSTNSSAVCRDSNARDCGSVTPETIGVIYDEDRFRVDLFVNARFLKNVSIDRNGYLPLPKTPLSLTSSLGLAASGAFGQSSTYNVQNRTVIGVENARIRMNSSIASHLGFVMDDLVGEIDRKDLRYSGGLFWAPGNDFTGQRRIIGAGVGTQFDTWADQQSLHGTPLILFLASPSRVEILMDGRLISARSYPAGNVDLDTSSLPDGSYSVLLRIHQSNGSVREERRFFVKNQNAPPTGHPIYYAYAGLLANTERNHPISPSSTVYYQAGAAWRLSNTFALDVGALGTQHKAIAQAGAWLILHQARFRISGLASSAGDTAALVQGSWGGHGPLNLSFDIRRIWSHDGQPLIPLPSYVNSFGETPPTGVQLATGSYTQATASLGLRLGNGFIGVVGSFRKDRHQPSDYTIGPTVNYPVINRGRFQLVFEATAERTRSTTAAFAGFRALITRGGVSVGGSLGESIQRDRDDNSDRSRSRAIGNVTAQYSHEGQDGTLLNVEAGADRSIDTSTLNAGTTVYSRFGNLRADLIQNVEGSKQTQYDVSYETGIALTSHAASVGGKDLQQSALIVTVHGDSGAAFNVLVDEAVRGRVKAGQRFSLFLPGYRIYSVRLVPTASATLDYDSATRAVTLFPGNVQLLDWRIESFFTIFAQAMTSRGAPIADALVRSPKGISQTDLNGYFQLDVRSDDPVTIERGEGQTCQVALPKVMAKNDFASLGKVVCS
jgi:hypothetical protein